MHFTAEVVLEGIAKAGAKGKCTAMGRAAMSLDLQVNFHSLSVLFLAGSMLALCTQCNPHCLRFSLFHSNTRLTQYDILTFSRDHIGVMSGTIDAGQHWCHQDNDKGGCAVSWPAVPFDNLDLCIYTWIISCKANVASCAISCGCKPHCSLIWISHEAAVNEMQLLKGTSIEEQHSTNSLGQILIVTCSVVAELLEQSRAFIVLPIISPRKIVGRPGIFACGLCTRTTTSSLQARSTLLPGYRGAEWCRQQSLM